MSKWLANKCCILDHGPAGAVPATVLVSLANVSFSDLLLNLMEYFWTQVFFLLLLLVLNKHLDNDLSNI